MLFLKWIYFLNVGWLNVRIFSNIIDYVSRFKGKNIYIYIEKFLVKVNICWFKKYLIKLELMEIFFFWMYILVIKLLFYL